MPRLDRRRIATTALAALPAAAIRPLRQPITSQAQTAGADAQAWAIVRHYPYYQPPQEMIGALQTHYAAVACTAAGFQTLTIADLPWTPPADAATPMVGTPLGLVVVYLVFATQADWDAHTAVDAEWTAANTGMVLSVPSFDAAGPVVGTVYADTVVCGS